MSAYQAIQTAFTRAGARVSILPTGDRSGRPGAGPMSIDVSNDGMGEFFDIRISPGVELGVTDVRPKDHHLVLSASNWLGEDRFLCGRDEYHWFVAALPAEPQPDDVKSAKEALKPEMVKRREQRKHRGRKHRKSDVYLRQGEWFFVPCPHAGVVPAEIVRFGLISRPGGKPHICGFLYEEGEREYECDRYPKLAFYESEYRHILKTRKKARRWNWRPLPFRPIVYVRGWIEHDDHSPLYLDIWHRVEQNAERNELSMSRMAYRD